MTLGEFSRWEAMSDGRRAAPQDGDYLRVAEREYEFHQCLIPAAGYDVLDEVRRTTDAQVRPSVAAATLLPTDLGSIVARPKAARQALRSRDPGRARNAMVKHREKSRRVREARVLSTLQA